MSIAVMNFDRFLPRTLRYIEWIYITVHFGMWYKDPNFNLLLALGCYAVFFMLGWLYPRDRPHWQRFSYVILGLTTAILGRRFGVDIGLFLFFYLAKSYFLLGRRFTIPIAIVTGIIWTGSEYLAEIDRVQTLAPTQVVLTPDHPLKFTVFTLLGYSAASTFIIMFSAMVVAEQKSRQRADDLAQQVESLAATLERTRIAREIHDSLGHTLTDLDMQLAVAQQLRFQDIDQAFEAVDTAKVLTRQCIEDVSDALDRMRQSNFDLNQALTALMEQVRHSSTLQVQWEVNLPMLPVHKSYQIYCIVKEGVINIQKHARASQVSFLSRSTPQEIVLNLKDNGIGFDPTQLHTGFGLQGMIERVQLLGGDLNIDTAPGQGTHIQVILPR